MRISSRFLPLLLLVSSVAACGGSGGSAPEAPSLAGPAVPVGREAPGTVRLFENHSSALVAWRTADLRGRIVLHVDGHVDFDWLPDDAISRIASAGPTELARFEIHPYDGSRDTVRKFGIWNFLYPAFRLGIVREIVWVVPDGTYEGDEGLVELLRTTVFDKMHGVSVKEAEGFRIEAGRAVGRIAGVPITICRLADLPEIREPVLLDIDCDFFTTRSARTLEVVEVPWTTPQELVGILRDRGIATDFATISVSSFGGFTPPVCRWLAPAVEEALLRPQPPVEPVRRRIEAESSRARGELARAEQAYRALTDSDRSDASAWYGLSRVLEASGRAEEAREARSRAVELDPVLAHGELMEADRLWLSKAFEGALEAYRGYLESSPRSPYAGYALRRIAGVLSILGRTAEAVDVYREAISISPDHADTRMNFGLALLDLGRVAEAMEQLRAARRIEPEWGTYAMALGSSLARGGKLEEALAEFSFAVSRRPTWAQARAQLAAGFLLAGREGEALEHARIAEWLEPRSPLVRALRAELARRGIGRPASP